MDSKLLDDELNLKPYLLGIARRWPWMVAAALVGALVAGALSMLQPQLYEATSNLLFIGERDTFDFDPRFSTDERTGLSETWTHREGLMALAKSRVVESQLPAEVRDMIEGDQEEPLDMTDLIQVNNNGDLISIVATAESADKAQALANGWATTFVAVVNRLYQTTPDLATSEAQVAEAQQRYDEAQVAYVDFLGRANLDQVDSRVNALVSLINNNRLAQETLYQESLARTHELALILEDAGTLRAGLQRGDESGAGETLAALALRIRAVGGTEPLQIQVADLDALPADRATLAAEMDRLIEGLQAQLEAMRTENERLAATLASDRPANNSAVSAAQMDSYFAELERLRQERAILEGQREVLEQERTVTLEALDVVSRKLAEQRASAPQASPPVRLAGVAPLPLEPESRGTVFKALAGAMGGASLGVVAALLATLGVSLPALRRVSPKRQADSPSYS